MRIFLSAVSGQFKLCRDALASDLRAVGAEVSVQEDFQQLGGSLLEKLEEYIAECDRVIVLLGNAYGWAPDAEAQPSGQPQRSYTQWEYFFSQGERLDQTKVTAKETFVYLASSGFLASHPVEQTEQASALQQQFVSEIRRSGKDRSQFSSLHELRALVLRDGFRLNDRGMTAVSAVRQIAARYNITLPMDGGTPITASLRPRLDELIAEHSLFAGRDIELGAIDRHLSEHTGGYLFITGRAGFGKTALLANWVRRRESAGNVTCYHFLSRKYDKLANEFFSLLNLCQQLVSAHNLRGVLPTTADELRSLYAGLLRLPTPNGEKLIVVLDGIDEALGWSPGKEMFPRPLPDGVFVVFSARAAGGELISKLGFGQDEPDILEVERLDEAQLASFLSAFPQLDRVVHDEAFIKALAEKSKGDPFYLHFLLQDIVKPGVDPRECVKKQPEGLTEYLDSWWQELCDVGGTAPHLNEDALNDTVGYLAVADGSLRRSELVNVSSDDALNGVTIDRMLHYLRRFLVGNDTGGYSLCHDRFRDYIKVRMSSDEELEKYRKRLVAYCSKWREHKSPYALEHYALHLRQEGAQEDLFALVQNDDWMQARLASDIMNEGYMNDVVLAWREAERLDELAIASGRPAQRITLQVWCALTVGSIQSYRLRFDAAVITSLLKGRALGTAQALLMAGSIPREEQRIDAIVDLCPLLLPNDLTQAFEVVRGSESDHAKSALVRLFQVLPPAARNPRASIMVESTRSMKDATRRADSLFRLASLLEDDTRRGEILDAAVAAGKQSIDLWRSWGNSFARCAVVVKDPRMDSLIDDVLTAVGSVGEREREFLTAYLFDYLDAERRKECLESLKRIEEAAPSMDVALAILPCLSDSERNERVAVLLDAVARSQNSRVRREVLLRLAPHLQGQQLVRAGSLAASIADRNHRFAALCGLFERDLETLKSQMPALLKTVAEMEGNAAAFARVSTFLETDLAATFQLIAIQQLRYLGQEEAWTCALLAFKSDLPADLQSELGLVVYRAGLSVGNISIVTRGLDAVAEFVKREIMEIKAIELAQRLIETLQRMEERQNKEKLDQSSVPLASRFGAELDGLMDHTSSTWHALRCLSTLLPLAGDVPENLSGMVLAMALSIRIPFNRAQAIAMLIPLLPPETLGNLVDGVELEPDADSKAELVRGLAQRFSVLNSEKLLQLAARVGSPAAEVEALCDIAPHLPTDRARECLQTALSRLDAVPPAKPHAEPGPMDTMKIFSEFTSIKMTTPDSEDELHDPTARCCAALLRAVSQMPPDAVADLAHAIMARAEECAGRSADAEDRVRLHSLRSRLLDGLDRKNEVQRALEVSERISDPIARAKLVFPLLEFLDDLTQQGVISQLLHGLSTKGRYAVLTGLRELPNALRRLGGSAATAAVPATIQACIRTWPCYHSRGSEAWGDPQKQTLKVDGTDLPLIPPDIQEVEVGLAALRLIALQLSRHSADWIADHRVAFALTEGYRYILAPTDRKPMRPEWSKDTSLSIVSTARTFGRMATGAVDLMKPTERDIFNWGGDKAVMLKIGEVLASCDDQVSKALGKCFSQVANLAAKNKTVNGATESTG